MAKQDGRRPYEAQPKLSLPIPPRAGAFYKRLQEIMKSFGIIG